LSDSTFRDTKPIISEPNLPTTSLSVAHFIKTQMKDHLPVKSTREPEIPPSDDEQSEFKDYEEYEEWRPEDNKVAADTRTELHEKLGY
jgi:hypothetical protein